MAKLTPVVRKWLEAEDERLIEARMNARTLTSNAALARTLAPGLGRTELAVRERLNRLRITIDDRIQERELAQLAPQPLKPATRPGLRKCLCCGRDFMSDGAHNRLCLTCRQKNVSPYAPGAC